MSYLALAAAWALKMAPAHKLVLISLADQANDDGICWPGIASIATRTCWSERSIQRILLNLEKKQFLAIQHRPGRSNVYRVPVIHNPRQHTVTPDSTVTPDRAVTPTHDKALSPPPTTELCHPEPSFEPSKNNGELEKPEIFKPPSKEAREGLYKALGRKPKNLQ